MTTSLNEGLIRNLTGKVTEPLVFRGLVGSWQQSQWDLDKWCSVFGEREIPFRCMKRNVISDDPCWERKCKTSHMTFKNFVDKLSTNDEWMYFDYKYLHEWFSNESDLCKEFSWKLFGFPEKGASDSTLWVGSSGAHTPAHQDTYGVNIVAQLHGKKRWLLFPPGTSGLKPTRVPYEESSVYSELNFYCPSNLSQFNGLTGCRTVDLCAGDALLVPRGWWHYVQNVDPVNIALNIWLPHEKDSTSQVSEALIKILVAQVCKDLPQETAKLIVNPNEDDLSDTPLSVLFLQLETVVKSYLDNRRKMRRMKRQKTHEDDESAPPDDDIDLNALVGNKANNLEIPKVITNDELVSFLNNNISMYADKITSSDDEVDGDPSSLGLTKALIDAFSQSNVIDAVKQNLFARLS